jgi:hypothetical protein
MTMGLNVLPDINPDFFIPGLAGYRNIRVNSDDAKVSIRDSMVYHTPFNQQIQSGNQIDLLGPQYHEILSGNKITQSHENIFNAEPTSIVLRRIPRTEVVLINNFSEFLYTFVPSSTTNAIETSLASLQAPIILEATADFESDVRDFMAAYGADAILALAHALVGDEKNERRWEFVSIVGEDQNVDTHGARRQFLLDILDSDLAGDRLASASALGRLSDPTVLPALKAQARREQSKIAKSVMLANIKALEKHGAVPQTAN